MSGARYVKDDAPKSLGVADVRLATPEAAELKTFSFTQSTGIWKGSLIWDFGDPLLNPVKMPFEDVLVLGEEALEGFGTYERPGELRPIRQEGQSAEGEDLQSQGVPVGSAGSENSTKTRSKRKNK